MEHKLTSKKYFNQSITVKEQEQEIVIEILNNNLNESITLTKEELRSFIGTLLHVQQRLK